ncbi:MAG: hypothetical protein ABII71_03300 [Candidatus Micrarchaeota archaeon]
MVTNRGKKTNKKAGKTVAKAKESKRIVAKRPARGAATNNAKAVPKKKAAPANGITKTVRQKANVKAPAKKIKIQKPDKEELKKQEIARRLKEIKAEMVKVNVILSDSAVRQMLIDLGGENALTIIKNFYGNLSDEELAKKLKLKISDVRATLNRLHSEGIVNYVREKDHETGWYSYSWSLNRNKMERWVNNQADRFSLIKDDNMEYYFCTACGVPSVVDFESASDSSFKCSRCNKSLEYVDDKWTEQLNEILKRRL